MLENTRVVAPAGAAVDRFGYLKNGTSDVTENVQLQKEIPAPIGGEADGILWRYDPGTKTFTASGAGVFRRSEDYDEYLAQMRCFRTEYGITALDDSVIRDSENLQSVFLVRSIERIGRNNFVNCPRLAEINLPNGLKYVMEGCFCGSGLKTVNFPRTLLRIDDGCFSNMPELEIISFDFSEELSRLAVGDDCFAHLPAAKELRFGDGPWIIGDRSFCDMPQLRIMTLANFDKRYDPGSDEKRYFRIFFGADTCYIGDGSFADLPNANYQKGLRLYTNDVPQMYHYVINNDSRLRSIGKGSLGFIGGEPDGSYYIGGSDQHDEIFAARYAEANGLGHYSILEWNYLSPHPAPGAVGDANLDSVVDENDAAAMLAYLNQPLKAEGCGDPRTSDVDLSAKLDNRDLILLRRYLAGWPDLDSIFRPRYGDVRQARSNYSAATGLKLTTDSVSVDYEEGLILRVPVRSVYNAGYISGSATVKWNAELMDLWDIEYNDALAPENGTAAIDNNLHYLLTDPSGITPAVDLDYAGEQVIRFGDDFRTENYTGTGELFTLVFRLRAEGKPDPYLLQRDCEIVLKNVDVYDAALNAVRAEQTEVGTVTVTLSDPVIRSVSIAGILNPHPGQHPVDSAVLPEGASYRLRYNDDLSGSVVWLTMENYRMKESETFEAGKQYQALILLEPVSNAYRFSSSEVFTGTVNGMSATPWASNDGTEATLLYTFTCANGVPVSGVSLNKTELKLEPGGSDTLAATVAPTNASNQRFSWSSSDSAVASVDQNGKVTAHKGGDAIITVTTEDQGKTAFCAVRVDIGVSGVTLNTNKLNLYVDGSETLRAMVAPYNVINKNVVWSSSDGSVASVDQNGRVTTHRAGSAVITVVTEEGGKKASCTVTVKNKMEIRELHATNLATPYAGQHPVRTAAVPESVPYRLRPDPYQNVSVFWLRDGNISMSESETFEAGKTYTALVLFELGAANYCFANSERLQGTINGMAATPWANDEGTEATLLYAFTCAQGVPVSGITLNKTALSLDAGESETLTATVSPGNASNQSVVWRSSDDSIASVDQNGRVRAIRGGTAVVTVVTADSGKTASCTVTVTGGIVNPFVDIKEGEFYYDAVLWAVNHEPQITTGTSATKFSPGKTCTRGQIVTFLYRAMK